MHDRLLEGNRGLDSSDHVFVESPRHAFDTSGATGGGGDDFGDHRIVIRWNRVAGVGVGVDADASPAWCVVEVDIAWARLKIFLWILGVDSAFDRVTARLGLNDIATQMFASGNLYLLLYEIASINLLGDRMFHLNTGIHFHEVEVSVIVDKILDSAGICVADALAEANRCFAHLFAKLGRHER